MIRANRFARIALRIARATKAVHVPGKGGGQICLCVAIFMGKKETNEQISRKNLRKGLDSPVNKTCLCVFLFVCVFLFRPLKSRLWSTIAKFRNQALGPRAADCVVLVHVGTLNSKKEGGEPFFTYS